MGGVGASGRGARGVESAGARLRLGAVGSCHHRPAIAWRDLLLVEPQA